MKLKTIAFAFFGVLALASCKKDYNCTCTIVTTTPAFVYLGQTVQTASTTTVSATSVINDKKKDAETTCTGGSSSTSVASAYAQFGADPTTVVTTCAIAE